MTTITLYEPTVDTLIADGWVGLRLLRAATEAGAFTAVTDIPYVAGQETYVYEDVAGAATDWYKTARYVGATLSDYSNPFPARAGTTLARIRQEAVRMVAGWNGLIVSSATGGGTQALTDTSSSLTSSVARGKVLDGAWIHRPTQPSADKVRMVAEGGYNPATGTLSPDLAWAIAPAVGETYEVIVGSHLHPTQNVAPAIRRALMRVRFVDTVVIVNDAGGDDVDLTSFYPWLTDPTHLRTLAPADADGWYSGHHHIDFRPAMKAGSLWVHIPSATTRFSAEVLRPHGTVVNGADSLSGPIEDGDTVRCPLDWAVAGTVVEIYRQFGIGLSSKENAAVKDAMALWAAEFSRLSKTYLRQAVQARPAISAGRIGVGARDW